MRPVIIIFIAITLAAGAVPMPPVCMARQEADQASSFDAIYKQKSRIRKLQENIIDHKMKVLSSKKRERHLLEEVERLNRQLLEQRRQLEDARQKQQQQDQVINQKTALAESLLAEKSAVEVHVKKRLAAYYRMGGVGLINVVFSSKSLPDLLFFQDSFQVLLDADRKEISSFMEKISGLRLATSELLLEKKAFEALLERVDREEKELAVTRDKKNTLLKKAHQEKKLYRQAAEELEMAAARLADDLEQLKKKSRQQPAAESSYQAAASTPVPPAPVDSFAARKGTLVPPVAGAVIIDRDSGGSETQLNSFSKGIDIEAPEGETIRAVFKGNVLVAGYMKGYGNMLIMDHGDQFYSMVAGASELVKQEGDRVAEGEVIGTTGSSESLPGGGIHFEIRRGAQTLEPLQWLNRNRLTIKTK